MINVENLSFSYGKTPVLEGVYASFSPGKVYGIVGPNGCGKTTFLHLLCGLLSPQSGKLSMAGVPYSSYHTKDRAKMISLLPQTSHLPSVTVYDLVCRGRYPYLGLTRALSAADRRCVKDALSQARVSHLAHRRTDTLSGGELQRVCLALALAQDTPYLCLDEPTAFLDIAQRFALCEELNALKNQGKCVIAVLHDLSLALGYCDDILVFSHGKLQAWGSPESIASSGILESVFQVSCHPVLSEGKREFVFSPRKDVL